MKSYILKYGAQRQDNLKRGRAIFKKTQYNSNFLGYFVATFGVPKRNFQFKVRLLVTD